jgi:predicted RecB family nuclease
MTDEIERPRVRWEETPAGRVLAELGQEHERQVVARLVPAEQLATPQYPPGDLDAGAAATAELVRARAPFISQGVLKGEVAPGVAVRGLADLLERRDDVYRVIEIKASRRLKTSQVLQAAAYTELLSGLAGVADPVMVDGMYRQYVPPYDAARGILLELVTLSIPRWLRAGSDAFHRTPRCAGCPFDPLCREDARSRLHLSAVPGCTPALATRLAAIGVHDIPGLLTLGQVDLHQVAIDGHLLQRLKGQALACVDGRIVPTGDAAAPPAAPVELFLEVEPDPTARLPCRLGLLKRDRTKGLSAYRSLVMPTDPAEAARKVRSFLELAVHQATKAARDGVAWTFLYYGSGTIEAWADLVTWMGWGDELLEEMLLHATDILAVVRRGWHVPVEGYTLAQVLGATGCAPVPGDTPGFAMHVSWRRNRDEALIRALHEHGEATARALMELWDWVESARAG